MFNLFTCGDCNSIDIQNQSNSNSNLDSDVKKLEYPLYKMIINRRRNNK